jgi:hypothetical protein
VHASRRLLIVAAVAAVLASVDLVVKSAVPTEWWAYHYRSDAWAAGSIALLIGACALALVPSRAVAFAAGVVSGGVIGNLVSARMNGNRVPNPLVIGGYGGGFAFNVADVFILLGNVLLMAASIVVVIRNRHLLEPPRAWERALLRRLGLDG